MIKQIYCIKIYYKLKMFLIKEFHHVKKLGIFFSRYYQICLEFHSIEYSNKNCRNYCSLKKGTVERNQLFILNARNSEEKLFSSMNNSERKKKVSVAIVGSGDSCIYTSILLKQNLAIKEIKFVDMDNSQIGSIYDIKQIDTVSNIKYYKRNNILNGLCNVDIVALMDKLDLSIGNQEPYAQLLSSSAYVRSIAECLINICPNAIIAVFINPVTATLPLVSEIFKNSGIYNPNKIIGSGILQSMRMKALTAKFLGLNASSISIPVAGGVDASSVVPLLSRSKPFMNFKANDQVRLVQKLRSADNELFENQMRGPSVSSGLAAAKFISILVNGYIGKNNCIGSAYVKSNIFPSCHYMMNELQFGPNGVEKNFGLPCISCIELSLIEQACSTINKMVKNVTALVENCRN